MTFTNERTFVGSTLLDEQGETIGVVKDVVYEEANTEPTWLVVKAGMLRGEHYVPAMHAYRTANDDVVVPYDKRTVSKAPKAHGDDHVVSHENREALIAHYGL
jgi:hypothetical protein